VFAFCPKYLQNNLVFCPNAEIIPIEVSGKKGSMQSMNLFLEAKNQAKGIRISAENFSFYD